MTNGIHIPTARLHDLLTDAHVALVEHRTEQAGAILNALRKITAPDAKPLPVCPPPKPPTVAITYGRPRHQGSWNEERATLLASEWPICTDRKGLLDRINAIPHPKPVPSVEAMREKALALGIMAPRRVAILAAQAAKARPLDESLSGTPERMAMLNTAWCDPSLSVRDIWRQWNAMPGKPLQSSTTLYGYAKKLGHSTMRPQSALDAAPPEPVAAVEAPPPVVEEAAPPAPVKRGPKPRSDAYEVRVIRPDMPADDLEDGDAKIRAGWNAPRLADWLGCTVAQAEVWCRTLREADAVAAEMGEQA